MDGIKLSYINLVQISPVVIKMQGIESADLMVPGIYSAFKSFSYMIMKVVTPCFNRPSLLNRSLVG